MRSNERTDRQTDMQTDRQTEIGRDRQWADRQRAPIKGCAHFSSLKRRPAPPSQASARQGDDVD
eukprot:3919164-Pyramimonas_sp.AAC.1